MNQVQQDVKEGVAPTGKGLTGNIPPVSDIGVVVQGYPSAMENKLPDKQMDNRRVRTRCQKSSERGSCAGRGYQSEY